MSKYWRGEAIKKKAYACALAYTVVEFENALEKIEDAASGTSAYLLEVGTELWSRAHFDKTCKSDHITNNFTESFNKFIKASRDKPICSMIMEISFLCMKIIHERCQASQQWDNSGLVPRVKKIIDEFIEHEKDYSTLTASNGDFCVRKLTGEHWTLNTYRHECSCGVWQLSGIPCIHAVHLIRKERWLMHQLVSQLSFLIYIVNFGQLHNSLMTHLHCRYVNPMLSVATYKSTYQQNLVPIPHETEWPKVSIKYYKF